VEMRNEYMAVFVFHAGKKLGEHHRGIRSPVAVVSAVQAMVGAVKRDLKMRVATCTEDDGLLSALIDGAVADKPDVTVHQFAIGVEDLFEMRRASLLFSLPDEADIGVQRNA